jgi:hypothetical protein
MNKRGKDLKKFNGKRGYKILIALAVFSAVTLFVSQGVVFSKQGKSFQIKGGETRPVLNPLLFTDRVREAYTAAKKYPKVIDQVYCYCNCDNPPFNHKSLLSCFVEDHGAG